MNKRGISPLISWVLIIGFVIALAAFISGWAVPWIRSVPWESTTPDIYCEDVQIDFDVCKDTADGKLRTITVKNKGKYSLVRLTISRATTDFLLGHNKNNNQPLASCYVLLSSNEHITPGEEGPVILGNVGYIFDVTKKIEDGLLEECPISGGSGDQHVVVTEIGVLPWIEVEDEKIPCVDKKVTIKGSEFLNTPCP